MNQRQDNDEMQDVPLLGFFAEDRHFIQQLSTAVRSLVQRPSATPADIYHLAKLLFALEQLPRPTPGMGIELELGHRYENGESNHLTLTLDRCCFSVGKCCYLISDPAVGGDSQSEIVFAVEGEAREIADETAFMDWVESFRERAADPEAELVINDNSDSSGIDWDAEPCAEDWDRVESKYS